MGAVVVGTAGLAAEAAAPRQPAPAWDRFAHWPMWPARLALLVLLALLVASALVPLEDPAGMRANVTTRYDGKPVLGAEEYDQDIALYDAVIRKVQAGQNYYGFIVEEHRLRDYPVRPGLSVRLPTLAYIEAGLNTLRLGVAASIALMLATIWAWWRRFGEEPGVGRLRKVATAMAFVGASLMLNRHYYSLHELWAGMLLMLSFGLHRVRDEDRPGRWIATFAVAALALFIREHSLPFVLLMGAFALWRREWREAAAWGVLVTVFLGVLAWHLSLIAPQVLPSDPQGPSWWAFRGLSGWLGNVGGSSNLRLLPHWLAGPLVILTTLGWAGWRTPAGLFGFLIAIGYGVLFMFAGRWDNFYWGAMVAPMLTAGLAFAPRALGSMWQAARLR
ncbi:DUF2079 domain-containing protein [Novosphingobium sp. 9U]|uniref:DUF2079 domain-containing protein n=1 Tax=Novosphingobium sp. 9U TaxID=2653158 RepID=UPI0012F08AF5|nr:DUF2079 domain-containing protein [Novosphingobium sp. 9U]VWX49647.1 conserved membrane hypothetical protein [Novosphingobium sp. 9U]